METQSTFPCKISSQLVPVCRSYVRKNDFARPQYAFGMSDEIKQRVLISKYRPNIAYDMLIRYTLGRTGHHIRGESSHPRDVCIVVACVSVYCGHNNLDSGQYNKARLFCLHDNTVTHVINNSECLCRLTCTRSTYTLSTKQ